MLKKKLEVRGKKLEITENLRWKTKKHTLKVSGDNDLEDTPVPIPNTEVKL